MHCKEWGVSEGEATHTVKNGGVSEGKATYTVKNEGVSGGEVDRCCGLS